MGFLSLRMLILGKLFCCLWDRFGTSRACVRLGGRTYTDEEIDKLMLPRIAGTRHQWEKGN